MSWRRRDVYRNRESCGAQVEEIIPFKTCRKWGFMRLKAAPHPFGNLAIHRDSGCLKSWSSLHLQIFVNARCLKDRILVKKILNIQHKRKLNCTLN